LLLASRERVVEEAHLRIVVAIAFADENLLHATHDASHKSGILVATLAQVKGLNTLEYFTRRLANR
jgi:hypothetical protein